MSSRLYICLFTPDSDITQSLTLWLNGDQEKKLSDHDMVLRDHQMALRDRYYLHIIESPTELTEFVCENKEKIDCLIILYNQISNTIITNFYEQGLILPVVIIESPEYPIQSQDLRTTSDNESIESTRDKQEIPPLLYHIGEIKIKPPQINNIAVHIDKAITQFLYLAPSCSISDNPEFTPPKDEQTQNFLLLQQRRLASKLKERLGYLGIYYNRKSEYFYRNLEEAEKRELIEQLSLEYRKIIIAYFGEESEVNQMIDEFVNQCFFADLSVSQILEIHMELMDEFAQQLKLEGRNEEVLLDYRLALIDIIAHLCEMYRRSIPREDLPFEVLFPVD